MYYKVGVEKPSNINLLVLSDLTPSDSLVEDYNGNYMYVLDALLFTWPTNLVSDGQPLEQKISIHVFAKHYIL